MERAPFGITTVFIYLPNPHSAIALSIFGKQTEINSPKWKKYCRIEYEIGRK